MVVVPNPLHEGGQYHTMMGQVSLGIGFGVGERGRKARAWEWQDRDDCGMVQALCIHERIEGRTDAGLRS